MMNILIVLIRILNQVKLRRRARKMSLPSKSEPNEPKDPSMMIEPVDMIEREILRIQWMNSCDIYGMRRLFDD